MTEKVYPKIQIVDENDNLIGNVSYFEAKEMGAIKRAARVFAFNESGELLLQKRSKYINKALLFDQSAAGHVDEGETYLEAAIREFEEELGLTGFELELVAESYHSSDFFSNVYKTLIPGDTEINFDPHEVDSVYWMSPEEVSKLLNDKPELFTNSMQTIWPNLKSKLIK